MKDKTDKEIKENIDDISISDLSYLLTEEKIQYKDLEQLEKNKLIDLIRYLEDVNQITCYHRKYHKLVVYLLTSMYRLRELKNNAKNLETETLFFSSKKYDDRYNDSLEHGIYGLNEEIDNLKNIIFDRADEIYGEISRKIEEEEKNEDIIDVS